MAEEVLEDARLREAGLVEHCHVELGLRDYLLKGLLLLEGVHASYIPDTDGYCSPLPTGWKRLLNVSLVLRCLVGFSASVLVTRA